MKTRRGWTVGYTVMKGKSNFTSREAETIRELIKQKLVADKDEQKRIREKIRELGFYITDFTNKKRYTLEDFEKHIKIEG